MIQDVVVIWQSVVILKCEVYAQLPPRILSGWHCLCLLRLIWEKKCVQKEALSRKCSLFVIKL